MFIGFKDLRIDFHSKDEEEASDDIQHVEQYRMAHREKSQNCLLHTHTLTGTQITMHMATHQAGTAAGSCLCFPVARI